MGAYGIFRRWKLTEKNENLSEINVPICADSLWEHLPFWRTGWGGLGRGEKGWEEG